MYMHAMGIASEIIKHQKVYNKILNGTHTFIYTPHDGYIGWSSAGTADWSFKNASVWCRSTLVV